MAKQNKQNKLGSQKHEWKERTDDGVIEYRAIHHAKEWRIIWSYKVGRSEEKVWHELEEITPEIWQSLYHILEGKYRRGRLPFDILDQVKKTLEGE